MGVMLKLGFRPLVDSRKILAWIFVVLFLPQAAQAEEHEIESVSHRGYESMFFDPHFLQIAPGDSVAFVVTDLDHQPQSVFVPAGADHWKAEKGKSITVNFSHEGIYLFDCAYHNVMGMAGVILVGNPVNSDEARSFFEEYKKRTFAMNKDRLDSVWDPENQLLMDRAKAE